VTSAACRASNINDSYETDALHLTVTMALVVSTKQPFLVVHFRREAAEAPSVLKTSANDLVHGYQSTHGRRLPHAM